MPAFKDMMKEDELWKVVLFLKNIKNLQPPLSDEWQNPAAPSPAPSAAASPANPQSPAPASSPATSPSPAASSTTP
jgi:hypothetical protein